MTKEKQLLENQEFTTGRVLDPKEIVGGAQSEGAADNDDSNSTMSVGTAK